MFNYNIHLADESYRWGFITPTTTPEQFEENKDKVLVHTNEPLTALAAATLQGNNGLMEYIISKGDKEGYKELLFASGQTPPLHAACTIRDDDTMAYKAAKKLMQLGSPLNIITAPEEYSSENGYSPLDCAIINENFKTAGLLLRNGGTLSFLDSTSLTEAKKHIMPDSLSLFQMHFSKEELSGFDIPKEIRDYISSLTNKVELQM